MAFLDETGLNHLLEYVVPTVEGSYEYADYKTNQLKTDMTNLVANKVLDVWPVSRGGTGATSAGTTLLSNIGITSGTADAPATGTPGTIYIQYI